MVKREQLKQVFKNTYDREPTEEQLKAFEEYLKLIGVAIEWENLLLLIAALSVKTAFIT